MKYGKSIIKVIVFLLLIIGMPTYKLSSQETKHKNLITKFCLASFKAEMKMAGKKPHPEMGNFACNCFFIEINRGMSIDDSLDTCKKEASKEFNLSYHLKGLNKKAC